MYASGVEKPLTSAPTRQVRPTLNRRPTHQKIRAIRASVFGTHNESTCRRPWAYFNDILGVVLIRIADQSRAASGNESLRKPVTLECASIVATIRGIVSAKTAIEVTIGTKTAAKVKTRQRIGGR
jgi:hypothetical protein